MKLPVYFYILWPTYLFCFCLPLHRAVMGPTLLDSLKRKESSPPGSSVEPSLWTPPFLLGYAEEQQISYKDLTTLLSPCVTTQPKIWTRLFGSKSSFSHLQHACVNAKLRWVLEILKVKYTGFCFYCCVAAIVRWAGVCVCERVSVRDRSCMYACKLVWTMHKREMKKAIEK